jgi:hypothetical protein
MTPEEALIHAYEADIARLPQEQQLRFNAQRMAADHMAGKSTPAMERFRRNMAIGHPSYQPQNDEERALQDQMLSGYTGKGWTPDQLKGRTPGSYELSPGGQYLDQLDSRKRLYEAFDPQEPKSTDQGWFGMPGPSAWAGSADTGSSQRDGAAKLYAQQLGRKYAYLPGSGPGTMFPGIPEGGIGEILNPENFVGSFTTKMGGAVSDGASLIGTALLRKANGVQTDPMTAVGDAAVRSQGADFHRTNPALAADNGWRANDALIQQGRDAHAASEGMTAGDTFRSIGNHVLPEHMNGQLGYAQPVINAALSFGNGMLDGTGAVGSMKAVPTAVRGVATGVAKAGVPGVSRFARSTANEITKNLTARPTWGGRAAAHLTDEAGDATNLVELGAELMTNDPRSNSHWQADQHTEEAGRQQSIKQLENINGQIVRPQTNVTKAGNWLGGLLSK